MCFTISIIFREMIGLLRKLRLEKARALANLEENILVESNQIEQQKKGAVEVVKEELNMAVTQIVNEAPIVSEDDPLNMRGSCCVSLVVREHCEIGYY